ncbi:MAG: DUF5060 domain-containing protein [Verrucomicrobiae bacterium]|nr:DUF5060 domain-containing protein [Verrucomicrobiae bacterium]
MKKYFAWHLVVVWAVCCLYFGRSVNGEVNISGELKQWHKVTLTVDGPSAREDDANPNPFTDYRFNVEFSHESGSPKYIVPGYFAADGNAANTSASAGNRWRAHLSPDKPGKWFYKVSFVKGKLVALDNESEGESVSGCDGLNGSFDIAPTDKIGNDLRAKGRLQYVGKRYLQFAGTGEYFLKCGADAPENFLAYYEFDGTYSRKKQGEAQRAGEAMPAGLHKYEPHGKDWKQGDPTWKNGKGKNIIGALNYLASKGCNAFSFLTYNVGGDGDDVWPFNNPTNKLHYDCSKLDQWQIVFDHAQSLGMYLHFKMQETEMDDNRHGDVKYVPSALDGGALGMERKLYCRELIARFGYLLALNWNLGEENTQSSEEQRDMAEYIRKTDPYKHHIVVHTYPDWQDRVYPNLSGDKSALTGASLQNSYDAAHQRVLKWIRESEKAGKPWVVANDEQNPADYGVPPDPGYKGFDGMAKKGDKAYNIDDIRKYTLWGTLMAGGAGVEYYFGYKLPENDLNCEDWRSRDKSWDYCRIALEFFKKNKIPFWEMTNADEFVGNAKNDNSVYCFAKLGELYLIYLPDGGGANLNLTGQKGDFEIYWYSPRSGGDVIKSKLAAIKGGAIQQIGPPPSDLNLDWLIMVKKTE